MLNPKKRTDMKKIIILTFAALLFGKAWVFAGNDRHIEIDQLPQPAREFLNNYFPDNKVSYARMERDFAEVKYEVVLVDGSSIEFRRNGEWKEVDCKYSTSMPEGLVPQFLEQAVAKRYPEAKIVKIERDMRYYNIELSNDLDMRFDLKGNLLEIDD